MKISLIILSFFLLIGCHNVDLNLSNLEYEKLEFTDLPEEMKKFLMQPIKFNLETPSSLIVVSSKESDRYRLETINTIVGPWVNYMKLIDNSTNMCYKIKQGVPAPFFVFENKLYIASRFYIYTDVSDIKNVKFKCYILK